MGSPPDLNDPDWPVCLDPNTIVSSNADETEKKFRALQIVGVLSVEHAGMKVLDFGCGEGHVAIELSMTAEKVVGYDKYVARSTFDSNLQNCSSDKVLLTNSEDEMVKNGPYDIIMLYDVIDHIQGTEPVEVIKKLVGLLSENGVIYCRCHPWTSRHGGHLYEQKNLAYLHLMLTTSELAKHDIMPEPNLKIVKPLAAYEGLFSAAGLSIEDKKVTSIPPPEFVGKYAERIAGINWSGTITPAVAMKVMTIQFVDYILKRV